MKAWKIVKISTLSVSSVESCCLTRAESMVLVLERKKVLLS